MPPNLGGFFMVRSYYPSECHADYFDFERIEALKPAIEACGISTLSQSPMLGFHKQMDNRIKLLEEILSFRMQGVEFDNGDMYVDGHKAASDVRDEFVDRKSGSAGMRDRKSGSAGMPRPISYAVFCLKKKKASQSASAAPPGANAWLRRAAASAPRETVGVVMMAFGLSGIAYVWNVYRF